MLTFSFYKNTISSLSEYECVADAQVAGMSTNPYPGVICRQASLITKKGRDRLTDDGSVPSEQKGIVQGAFLLQVYMNLRDGKSQPLSAGGTHRIALG